MKKLWISAAMGMAVSACSWVDTHPGAERVVVIDRFQAKSCERVGTAKSQTLDALWFVERNAGKVREELLALARNQALKIGGNALVPESKPREGKQAFVVYRCP